MESAFLLGLADQWWPFVDERQRLLGVSKLSGMREQETHGSWTLIVPVASVMGLVSCLVLSRILPLT